MIIKLFCRLLLLFSFTYAQKRYWPVEEETAEYWITESEKQLAEALKQETLNTNVAQNVILFLGDGMGIATVTSGRIMKGQLQNSSGENTVLAMDTFPHCGLSKTYSVNNDVSDSATTATAYLCGVKGNTGTIGLNGASERSNCQTAKGNEVQSILIDSFDNGKSTGIVTTAHITHATPAGTYAHTVERGWYDDTKLPDEAFEYGCKDIAKQFYEVSDKITVAMGGGREYFYSKDEDDPEYPVFKGNRIDTNLINDWQVKHQDIKAEYIWNLTSFNNIQPEKVDKLLGLFERGHMQYELDRGEDPAGEPSLAEMTDKAIRILQRNNKGYFLLVEGGRIDHAHHANSAKRALREHVAFDEAIERALELTSESDTLIVVTADHSHTLTMGGYSYRGNSILGLANPDNKIEAASDEKPFTTLLYGTGPGYQGKQESNERDMLTSEDVEENTYLQQSAVPLASASHAGEDVSIMARGPMAHLIHGVHEQSYIPHVMRYASCVGNNQEHCNKLSKIEAEQDVAAVFLGRSLDHQSTTVALYAQFYILLTLLFLICLTIVHFKSTKNFNSNNRVVFERSIKSLQL